MMWRILKTEYSYNWLSLALAGSLFGTVTVAFLVRGGDVPAKSVPAYRAVLVASTAVLWLSLAVRLNTEKRDRICALLPVAIRRLSRIRLCILLVSWIGMATVFFTCNLIIRGVHVFTDLLWDSLSMAGMVLIFNAITFLHRDLGFVFMGRLAKIVPALILFFSMILLYSLFIFSLFSFESDGPVQILRHDLVAFYFSPWGGLILMALGAGLSLFDHSIFTRRGCYTE